MEMPSLYKVGHAFIYTSRGEGFGLTPIEAAACGLPVISCNNTGMGEYIKEDNSFVISTKEKEISSPEMMQTGVTFYQNQLFPKLGEEQIDQAVRHMRFVVNNYGVALERGKKLRDLVYDKFTWQVATERVAKRLKEICQNA
jgi:glycosyltransferase involved in cell wall biosynthesis